VLCVASAAAGSEHEVFELFPVPSPSFAGTEGRESVRQTKKAHSLTTERTKNERIETETSMDKRGAIDRDGGRYTALFRPTEHHSARAVS
jgi:hypothetical protein